MKENISYTISQVKNGFIISPSCSHPAPTDVWTAYDIDEVKYILEDLFRDEKIDKESK